MRVRSAVVWRPEAQTAASAAQRDGSHGALLDNAITLNSSLDTRQLRFHQQPHRCRLQTRPPTMAACAAAPLRSAMAAALGRQQQQHHQRHTQLPQHLPLLRTPPPQLPPRSPWAHRCARFATRWPRCTSWPPHRAARTEGQHSDGSSAQALFGRSSHICGRTGPLIHPPCSSSDFAASQCEAAAPQSALFVHLLRAVIGRPLLESLHSTRARRCASAAAVGSAGIRIGGGRRTHCAAPRNRVRGSDALARKPDERQFQCVVALATS